MRDFLSELKNFPRYLFEDENLSAKKLLYTLLILSFIFKLSLLIVNNGSWIKADSIGYIQMAEGIVAGKPLASFPNGYPLILAVLIVTTGGYYVVAAVLISYLISCLSSIVVFIIVRHISGKNAGLIAAVMISWLPNQIFYANDLLTEAPSTFFLLAGFYFIIKQKGFYAGLALALGVWIRTSFMPILLAAPFFAVIGKSERKSFAFAFTAGAVIPFIAEYLLNFAGITAAPSNLNINLLLAVNKRSTDSTFFINNYFSPEQLQNPFRHYIRFIIDNPGEYIIQRFLAIWEMWFYSLKDNFDSVTVKLIKLTRTPFFLFSVYGFIRYFREKNIRLLFIPVFFLSLIHFFFFGDDRFSFYAEPFTVMITVILVSRYYSHKAETAPGRH